MPNLFTRTAVIFPSPWEQRFPLVIQPSLPKAVPFFSNYLGPRVNCINHAVFLLLTH